MASQAHGRFSRTADDNRVGLGGGLEALPCLAPWAERVTREPGTREQRSGDRAAVRRRLDPSVSSRDRRTTPSGTGAIDRVDAASPLFYC